MMANARIFTCSGPRDSKKRRRICRIVSTQLPPRFHAKLLGQFWDNDRGVIVQSKMHFYRGLDDRCKIRQSNDQRPNVSKWESSVRCLNSAVGKAVPNFAAVSAILRLERSHVGQHAASRSHRWFLEPGLPRSLCRIGIDRADAGGLSTVPKKSVFCAIQKPTPLCEGCRRPFRLPDRQRTGLWAGSLVAGWGGYHFRGHCVRRGI